MISLLVIIEEIEDEEKPAKDNKAKQTKKKSQASEGENAKKQIVAIEGAHVPVLESEDEDEDGLPIPKGKSSEVENASGEKMVVDNDEQGSNKKRKAKAAEQDDGQERYYSLCSLLTLRTEFTYFIYRGDTKLFLKSVPVQTRVKRRKIRKRRRKGKMS